MNSVRWLTGQSIMMELEIVVSTICGGYPEQALPSQLASIVRQIPQDFKSDLKRLLSSEGRLHSFLEFASDLGNVLIEDDYQHASLTIRSLSVQQALADLEKRVSFLNLPLQASNTTDRLVELLVKSQLSLYERLGRHLASPRKKEAMLRDDARRAVQILKDGDLHSQFWLMLDRLYYQFWLPFREEQADKMRLAENTLKQALGIGEFPNSLGWLPEQNPLSRHPEMISGASDLGLNLFFWCEPIGLPDTWFVTPEVLGTSFAEPGEILETFRRYAERISQRTAALSDPTRLVILRLIREFGMYNTEIASFLGIARPTVSNHAKVLREAGLITSQQEGGRTFHQMQEEELEVLFDDLSRFLDRQNWRDDR